MRTANELIRDAKIALEAKDLGEVTAILCEALGHMKDFSWRTGVTWEWSEVKDCCYEIGEMIHEHGGIYLMRTVYRNVHSEMKYIAARYLERSWDGCGDGEWRG